MPTLAESLLDFLLAPLTAAEIQHAYSLLPDSLKGPNVSTVSIDLLEPSKDLVVPLLGENRIDTQLAIRKAQLILLDHVNEKCHEVFVNLTDPNASRFSQVLNAQPAYSLAEYELVEDLVRNNTELKEILNKKGLDINKVVVDLWSPGAGYKGKHEEDTNATSRLAKPFLFYQENPEDNLYARPLRGISPVIDLYKKQIRRLDIFDDIYIPTASPDFYKNTLSYQLKPLEITQPEGPSFQVRGHTVSWAAWEFRLGFNTREGVLLRTLSYKDPTTKKLRPIIYRASMAEMVVPYGDPSRPCYRKNAFDLGEEGIGRNLNSLEKGCDCLGEIFYFDVSFCGPDGDAITVKNGICMHEEDFGLLYKHTDWRTQESHQIRSRRLVVSCFATIANYDYGFNWYFYLDGRIEYEVKMTGIVSTEAYGTHTSPGEHYKYGTKLDADIYAPIHQHFFNMRLDFMVDGVRNRLYEVNTHTTPVSDPVNVQGNAFYCQDTLIKSEKDAARDVNIEQGRFWKISNATEKNSLGYFPSYALIPENNTFLKVSDVASVAQRASHLKHHLWCSPFTSGEFYPGGTFPNMRAEADGISVWSQQDRDLVDQDLVVWYNFGSLHIVRPEEWPLMPVATARFTLLPFGFFEKNPALFKPQTPACKL